MHRIYSMCISQAYMCIYSELCTMCAHRTSLIFVYKECTQFIFQQRDFLELCVHFSSLNCTLVQCTHKDILFSEALFLPLIISSYNASSQLLNIAPFWHLMPPRCVCILSHMWHMCNIFWQEKMFCVLWSEQSNMFI